jgi:hypothetical protein
MDKSFHIFTDALILEIKNAFAIKRPSDVLGLSELKPELKRI